MFIEYFYKYIFLKMLSFKRKYQEKSVDIKRGNTTNIFLFLQKKIRYTVINY